jgi:hypothetical protein
MTVHKLVCTSAISTAPQGLAADSAGEVTKREKFCPEQSSRSARATQVLRVEFRRKDATARTSSGCRAAGRWTEALIRDRTGFPETLAVQRPVESQFEADRSPAGWFPWKDRCQGPETDSAARKPDVLRIATMSAVWADA